MIEVILLIFSSRSAYRVSYFESSSRSNPRFDLIKILPRFDKDTEFLFMKPNDVVDAIIYYEVISDKV